MSLYLKKIIHSLSKPYNLHLLLIPIIDLLQQFENYVKGTALRKRPGIKKKNN